MGNQHGTVIQESGRGDEIPAAPTASTSAPGPVQQAASQSQAGLNSDNEGVAVKIFTNSVTTEKWYRLYQLAIIISGLFTTATFSAMYPEYKGESMAGTPSAPPGTADKPTVRPDNLQDSFRFFCILSFLASIVCIVCSFVMIILPYLHDEAAWKLLDQELLWPSICNKHALKAENIVQKYLASLIRALANTALFSFFLQLLLGFAAATAAADAFVYMHELKYASYALAGLACFLALLVLILYTIAVKKLKAKPRPHVAEV